MWRLVTYKVLIEKVNKGGVVGTIWRRKIQIWKGRKQE